MTNIQADWQEFIDADPAKVGDILAIVLSFGGTEGPVIELAVSLDDARDIVAKTIACLAAFGDPLAKEIGEEYFQ